MDKKMKIGLNLFDNDVRNDRFPFAEMTRADIRPDFALCHFDPNRFALSEACDDARLIGEKFRARGMEYIANFEFQNFSPESRSPDGTEWANRPDGTHRLQLPEEYLQAHISNPNFAGVMHDEFEHAIANRNLSIILSSFGRTVRNVFPLLPEKDERRQRQLLCCQVKAFAGKLKDSGAPAVAGEHVFPILYHTFARYGITPNFKSQKESCSDVQFAAAAGAAVQYKTELWNCVDMWFRNTHPGHSAEEMYHNLAFAWLAGVNRVYVESSAAMCRTDKNGEWYRNEIGDAYARFVVNYKGKDRTHSIEDYRPEVGIVRCDDTYWGQNDGILWKRMLYGNKKIRPSAKCREWIRAMSVITHGETGRNNLTWSKINLWSLRPHRSFASVNSPAVFDEFVRKETLSTLKLCFLCGSYISKETLRDVRTLVRENGLTVVTNKRFAPEFMRLKTHTPYAEIHDGKGTWILTENLTNGKVKRRVAPFLGEKGEIRLRFADGVTRLRIAGDGNSFVIIP